MSNPYQQPADPFGSKGNPYAAPGPVSYAIPQAGYYRPHRGPMILTLGIIGLMLSTIGFALCILAPVIGLALSIPAWVLGSKDLKAINRGEMDPLGKGVTTAGMVTGIVGTALGGIGFLVMIAIAIFFIVAIAVGSIK